MYVLFLSFALTHHYLVCLLWERFTTITQMRRLRIGANNGNQVMIVVTIYVTATWAIMAAITAYEVLVLNNHICFLPAFEKCIQIPKLSHAYVINFIIPAIWQTTCHTIVYMTTRSSLAHLNRHEERTGRMTGRQAAKIDKRRIRVTLYLNVLYGFIWISYGISAALKIRLSIRLGGIIIIVFNTISYMSFFVLPTFYFFMDKRFAAHVRNTFSLIKNWATRSTRVQPIQC